MLEKFQYRLKTDRNPIQNHSSLEYKYYKIEPASISLRKKKFKYKGIAEPKEYLLDIDTDVEFFKKKQKVAQEKKEVHLSKEDVKTPDIKLATNIEQPKPSTGTKPLIQVL